MTLGTRGLPVTHWHNVLPDALHSLQSLATNCTQHKRFFKFDGQLSTGGFMSTWLLTLGPVLLQRHVRTSKSDPLVDEVQLLQANPHYVHIRHTDGRETTIPVRHLTPL